MESLTGVYHILTTPFTADGDLDEESLRRLVELTINAGVDGLTILGVAGEAQKLTDPERRTLITSVMEVADSRVPVIIGTTREATLPTIAASREAAEAGAAGLMIAPPTFLQPGPALTNHFRSVADAVDLPIILQDFPPVNGVTLSPQAMAELVATVPSITTVKLEDPPTPWRIAQTLAMVERPITIVGGAGGVYLLDELRRGASGTMTGFAYPEVLVAIWHAWKQGDRQEAARVYYQHLPLLLFEGQPKIGLAIRKEILRRRGWIAQPTVRQPGPTLDDGIAADLTETMAAVGIQDHFD